MSTGKKAVGRPPEDRMPDWVGIRIGESLGSGITVQRQWEDSVMIMISNGPSGMTYRIYPEDCRRLAEWLFRAADRMDERTEGGSADA